LPSFAKELMIDAVSLKLGSSYKYVSVVLSPDSGSVEDAADTVMGCGI
jgi:hypothetical protein